MENKILLTDLFAGLQKRMISEAGFSVFLNHPVDKGDNSEINWKNWFEKYLPKRYKVEKATIIDSRGSVSEQVDVAIFDAQYSYLAFHENGVLYIPAESVYAVFEVKQDLNREHVLYAGQKAKSVRSLHRTSAPIPYAGGVYPPKAPPHIISGILTTRSSWKEAYGDPFFDALSSLSDDEQLDCGCTLEAGSFFKDYRNNKTMTSDPGESLVYFFLQLLVLLQGLGTVPAIDLNAYMTAIHINEVPR